jgi:hypothetical protein
MSIEHLNDRTLFGLVCDMEDDVAEARVFADAVLMVADTDRVEDEARRVFGQIAREILARCDEIERRRGELFRLTHPNREHFERVGWPGEEEIDRRLRSEEQPATGAALAELQSRAEALAAEYTAPLPGKAGDAGLIEAGRRLRDLFPRDRALYRDPAVSEADVEDQLEAIVAPARQVLFDYIEHTPSQTKAGAAVKLRQLLDEDRDRVSLVHLLKFVEREAAR